MNLLSIVFCCFLSKISSTGVLELNTSSDGFFLLHYRGAGGLSGVAPIIHAPGEFLSHTGRPLHGLLNITTVANEHIITPSFVNYHTESGMSLILAGFQSVFATRFARTYMMIPANRQLVLNPFNPADFVLDRLLTITRSTSDEHLQVRVSVSILNTTLAENGEYEPLATIESTGVNDFALQTVTPEDSFPPSIIQALYNALRPRGLRIDPGFGFDGTIRSFDFIGDLSDEVLDSFPIIQYRIHAGAGPDTIIRLYGRDYVGPLEGGIRELQFRSGDVYSLGLNTLSKVALYVDNLNRLIGFGEPL
jgi:hypothetical protein